MHALVDDELVDSIYEAAVVPDRWDAVLDRLSAASGGLGGILFSLDRHQVTRWTASASLRPDLVDWMAAGWDSRSTRISRMLALRHPGFVSDSDIYTEAELATEPAYVEFLRPRGLGWGAGTFMPMQTGETAVVTLERRLTQGPLTEAQRAGVDALRPHLARAVLTAVRLQFERARETVAALEALGLPAAMLGTDARVLATNALFAQLEPRLSVGARDKLRFVGPPHTTTHVETAIARACGPEAEGRTVALPAEDGAAAIAHFVPVRRSARDVFARAQALLIVVPVQAATPPTADLLHNLFDLSPAEARIARELVRGHSVPEIAARLRLSTETIRSHVRAALGKTGTHRQTALVSLLAGLGLTIESPSI